MVEPGLILDVIKAGKAVYDQAKKVKVLKSLSDDLADRAKAIYQTLEKTKGLKNNENLEDEVYDDAIDYLNSIK